MNKVNLGWYAFAAIGGLVSGLCFSRSQYHQGRIDMAEEFKEEIIKIRDEVLSKREEAE